MKYRVSFRQYCGLFIYKAKKFFRYVWTGGFFSRSFKSWMFAQTIEREREFFLNCKSCNYVPYWTMVERDLNDTLYRNGYITFTDYVDIGAKYHHVLVKAILEGDDQELIDWYLEGEELLKQKEISKGRDNV